MELEPITHLEKSIAGTVAPVTHLEKVIEQYGGGGGGGAVSSVNGKTGAVVLTAADLDNSFKDALLDCFANVAWTDEHGQDYYDALKAALYPSADLVSISAVYIQSGTVYTTDSLDDLRDDLVVTATYNNGDVRTVTAYTLSGTLEAGTSTITVTFGGKTTTFDVIVTAAPIVNYDVENYLTHCTNSNQASSVAAGTSYTATITADSGYAISDADIVVRMDGNVLSGVVSSGVITIASVTGDISITATATQNGYTTANTIMANSHYTYNSDNSIFFPDYVGNNDVASLDELQIEMEVQPQSSPSGTACIIGGKDTGGASDINGLQINIGANGIFAYAHKINTAVDSAALFPVQALERYVVKYENTNVSPFTLSVGQSSSSVAWTSNGASTSRLGLSFCATKDGGVVQIENNSTLKIGYVKIWDKNGNLLNHFVPAKRNSDNFVGMYDSANNVFITATQNTRYALGDWTVAQ